MAQRRAHAEGAQLDRAPCDREAVARGRAVVLAVQLDARPALGRAAAPVTPGEGQGYGYGYGYGYG